MSLFHSTVSRRDFMKFMAAVGSGAGAASLVTPVFHDLDELASSGTGALKRPWYVKERDYFNPTVETDWGVMKRRDPTHTGQEATMMAYYYGQTRTDARTQKGTDALAAHEAAKEPGYIYKSRARKASMITAWPSYIALSWAGPTTNATWTKGGGAVYTGGTTPATRGEPKWTGSPEEATTMMAAYMRYNGVGISGFGELDQRTKDQIISTNRDNSSPVKVVFENVDQGYADSTKQVIPSKQMYYFSNFEPYGTDIIHYNPASGGHGQDFGAQSCKPSTWNFLRYLGYQMLGDGGDNGTPFVEGAAANLTGVGETSRQGLYVLTPEFGLLGRLHNYVTDLPMAPTKPIDAGMFRFCHSCHKCADTCPPGAISQDKQPSWDLPQIQGKPNLCHNLGTKEFWQDGSLCRLYFTEVNNCRTCWGNCTFTVNNAGMVHQVVKSTVANTSLFNGFFFKMAESFGYGEHPENAEEWWDKSLPVFGLDTTKSAFDRGYLK